MTLNPSVNTNPRSRFASFNRLELEMLRYGITIQRGQIALESEDRDRVANAMLDEMEGYEGRTAYLARNTTAITVKEGVDSSFLLGFDLVDHRRRQIIEVSRDDAVRIYRALHAHFAKEG